MTTLNSNNNNTKTPVSTLQELCVKYREETPTYELIADGTDINKTFMYKVTAFDESAVGSGRSKKDSKHEAAVKLINKLKELPKYAADLVIVPDIQRCQVDADAVSSLLDICIQRNLPMANFEIIQASGAAHSPDFTIECRVSSIIRRGTFSTKKGAKQIAAQEVLKVIQSLPQEEKDMQLATLHQDHPSKLCKTYREYKQSDIKPMTGVKVASRHNYFLKQPQDKIEECERVIKEYNSMLHEHKQSAREKVNSIMKLFGFKYDIVDISDHFNVGGKKLMFELIGDYDCVIIGGDPEIYTQIVEYFQTMLNIS